MLTVRPSQLFISLLSPAPKHMHSESGQTSMPLPSLLPGVAFWSCWFRRFDTIHKEHAHRTTKLAKKPTVVFFSHSLSPGPFL